MRMQNQKINEKKKGEKMFDVGRWLYNELLPPN